MERKSASDQRSNTSTRASTRTKNHAKRAHAQQTKPTQTLKRATIKSKRMRPDIIVNKGHKSRAGSVHQQRHARAQKTQKSDTVSKFKKPSTGEHTRTIAHRDSMRIAPIVNTITKHMPSDYRSIVQNNIETADAYQHERAQSRSKTSNRSRLRLSPTTAIVALLTLAVAGVAYLNLSSLNLRIAASQAGFSAKVPSYSPSGFGISGPIEYDKGQITLNFSSETNLNYQIIERESNWDSQSLLANFVKEQDEPYITYFDRGLTIYIINDEDATWVNGGIWYTVDSDNLLNSEQLLKIASSL